MADYLTGLNDSQKNAVQHTEGPLLVLAGAGSGKTRVLTNRIARLVTLKKCKPSEILALTFTNKAAEEMRQRLGENVGKKPAAAMTVSTFHSFGVKILRESGSALGLPKNFGIIAEYDRLALLKTLMRGCGKSAQEKDPDYYGAAISRAKNAALDPFDHLIQTQADRAVMKIYKGYEAMLKQRHQLDFDDLLLTPVRLFNNHPAVLEEFRSKYSFISIDEFQDTNPVQLQLALMLAAPRNNIMVVGDDDQGIYSWRGATIDNIILFGSNFPTCTTVILNKNYRSTRTILSAAMAVVERNHRRTAKDITTAAGDGALLCHYKADDEEDEAQWIAQTIKTNHEQNHFAYRDNALLMRTNAIMRRFEEALRKLSVPYRVVGATSFFERKEIKDVLAYLRFFANTADELSLLRMIKVPNKGIVPGTLEALDNFAELRRMSLYDAIKRHGELDQLSTIQHEKLAAFALWLAEFDIKFSLGPLAPTARTMLESCGYLQTIAAETDTMRREHVEELLHGLESFDARHTKTNGNLPRFMQELSLFGDDNKDDDKQHSNGVTLMTIHKAKGLEFPCVFLCALDNALFPSPRAIEEGHIEEERRLFYVGMTRARKELFLTWPGSKVFRGKMLAVQYTSFLNEIPAEFLDGPLGQKQDEERDDFVDNFLNEMKQKFGSTEDAKDKTSGD